MEKLVLLEQLEKQPGEFEAFLLELNIERANLSEKVTRKQLYIEVIQIMLINF